MSRNFSKVKLIYYWQVVVVELGECFGRSPVLSSTNTSDAKAFESADLELTRNE